MRNLLRRLAARNAFTLVLCAGVLAGFEYLICAFVGTINVSGAVTELVKTLPPFLQSVFGDQLAAALSAPGILAFGWDHPVAHAVGAALAIGLATRAVAGELENGTLELVLSQPLSRGAYLAGQVGYALAALAAVTLAGVFGTVVGLKVFNLDVRDPVRLLKLAVCFFLLQAAWYGLGLLFSVFGREAGRVAGAGFMLVLLSYIAQAVGRLLPGAAFLLPYSLHSYYAPRSILMDNVLAGRSVAVLGAVSLVGLTLAAACFIRRDIP